MKYLLIEDKDVQKVEELLKGSKYYIGDDMANIRLQMVIDGTRKILNEKIKDESIKNHPHIQATIDDFTTGNGYIKTQSEDGEETVDAMVNEIGRAHV